MKTNIVIEAKEKDGVYRLGAAPEIKEPECVRFRGAVYAPGDFMENRKELLDPKKCHLVVDFEEGRLELVIDEKNHYRDVITGELKESKILEKFGINKEKFYSDKELAKFFRVHDYYFVNRDEHAKIVKELMKFKASVDVAIENNKDLRGNARVLYEKAVESNIPERFTMKSPLFEGIAAEEFTVHICAEADTQGVKFFLESTELFSRMEELKDLVLRKEIERFQDFGCAILKK